MLEFRIIFILDFVEVAVQVFFQFSYFSNILVTGDSSAVFMVFLSQVSVQRTYPEVTL